MSQCVCTSFTSSKLKVFRPQIVIFSWFILNRKDYQEVMQVLEAVSYEVRGDVLLLVGIETILNNKGVTL